jgi:hypothetical protein
MIIARKATTLTPQPYIILIRNSRLAATIGAALEVRLLRDGHRAIAIAAAPDELGCGGRLHEQYVDGASGREPLVVALYEDGLLSGLASSGFAAYVGVPQDTGRRLVSWDNGLGAILLPVVSARDLVEAVARHTPWSALGQAGANAEQPVAFGSRDLRQPIQTSPSRPAGPITLSRKLAVAGIAAAPLLVAGLPAAASAAVVTHTDTRSVSRGAGPADISAVTTSFVRISQAADGPAPAGSGAVAPQAQAPVTNSQANTGSWWQGAANALPNAAYYMVEGGKIGAAGGAVIGFVGGGIVGATAGTSLEPGGGTVAGWYGGAYSGAKAGGVVGGVLGAAAGFMYGFATSPTWSTTPGTQGNSSGLTNTTMNDQATTTTGPVSGSPGSRSLTQDGTTENASGSQGSNSSNAGTTSPGNGTTSSGTGTTSSGTGTTSPGTGTTPSGGGTSSGTGATSSGAGNTSSGAGNTSSGTTSATGSTSNGNSSGGGNTSGGNTSGAGSTSGGGTS